MDAQEREKLTRFLQQLALAQVGAKDGEAEQLIQAACGRQPDAHYLLVQRSLLLEQALENAQAEITQLKAVQAGQRGAAGSFLSSNAWGNSALPAATPPPVAALPPNSPAAASSFLNGGLLGTVAGTAAGVLAGSFLFQGIENLMGNQGGKSGLLSESTPASAPALNETAGARDDVSPGNDLVDLDSLGLPEGNSDWV